MTVEGSGTAAAALLKGVNTPLVIPRLAGPASSKVIKVFCSKTPPKEGMDEKDDNLS